MGDGADKGGKGKGKEGGEDGREGRLVAEKCWILAEVTVVDVKDSGGLFFLVLGLLVSHGERLTDHTLFQI